MTFMSEHSPHQSSSSPVQEARPFHTSEIGSLTRNGTEWLGSSSGVYFVNTVRRAFNAAFAGSGGADEQTNFPAAEEILAGRDTPGDVDVSLSPNPASQSGGSTSTDRFDALLSSVLGQLPDQRVASELVLVFFKAWHPLFPFLHGPTFLQDMEALYSIEHLKVGQPRRPPVNPDPISDKSNVDVRKLITFQLIINIAHLDRPDLILPVESRIKSTADVSRAAGVLASRHDIPTIQALLAAELYLVATIALRAASTVAGMVLRSIFQTGLHRCPLRYAQLSSEDCELRKRIFWSAYALDRHLSQSLGDPITLQDSDIDVCLSGRELHKIVSQDVPGVQPSKVIHLHMPGEEDPNERSEYTISPEEDEKQRREAALTAYVQYSRLTGRVIEIFHKSIHARFPKRDQIVYLTSDIENWWNDLPAFLSGADGSNVPSQQQLLTPFFSVLYQQLLLLLNRPALSLDPTSAEFAHGLQVCIKASRTTLSSLKLHQARGQTMFLPTLLSANWMAGLIIAFACLLGKYPKTRACADIKTCLELLQAMNSRYNIAKQCYLVLSSLLIDIRRRKASSSGYLAMYRIDNESPDKTGTRNDSIEPALKRRRVHPKDELFDVGSENSAHVGSFPDAKQHQDQSTTGSMQSQPISAETEQSIEEGPSTWNTSNGHSAGTDGFDPSYDSSAFIGLPNFTYPLPNSTLPELSSDNDMGMWDGMALNMDDIFQSATWENLIGSTGSVLPGGWEDSG